METADSGSIALPKSYTVGYLDQHISFSHPTVLEECCSALSEDEQWDFYKAEKILFGLGFGEADMSRSPHEYSGGYQLRINLCKTLLKNPDLLLLDEPTNYLDILSLRWMRNFLKSFPGESILITHDRSFMDSVSTHTMGLYRGKIKKIQGSTEKFYAQVEEENIIHEKTRLNQQKKVDHMQEFVDRFKAQASKAKQAQSRMKQIEKIEVADELAKEKELGFKFTYKDTHAKTLLRLEDLSFSWTPSSPKLFESISLEVEQRDRIAVIGKNGKGKTTFLSVVAQTLKTQSGSIIPHGDARIGYYQQTHKKDLDPKMTIVEEIASANVDLNLTQIRGLCGAMMFGGDDADKKIGVLSGGEQSRVLLGKILACPHNVLLLDEPTNHLDMSSVDSLEKAIADFPGAIILVTHSEGLLRAVANKLIVFQDGKSFVFDGSYDEFLEKVGWSDEDSNKENSKKTAPSEAPKSGSELQELNKVLRPLQRELAKIETKVLEDEEKMKELQSQILDISSRSSLNESDQSRLIDLDAATQSLQRKIDDGFEKMIEISDDIAALEIKNS